jgi:hypothetical protein
MGEVLAERLRKQGFEVSSRDFQDDEAVADA